MSANYNNCGFLTTHREFYYVSEAALLWCGFPPEDISKELALSEPIGSGCAQDNAILRHPAVPCLEKYSRAIHEAINNDRLPAGRDGRGCSLESNDHIAPDRRTVTKDSLKVWITKEFPANKPAFLFDEIERTAHPHITIEAFTALRAENKLLQERIDKATIEFKSIREKLKTVEQERDKLLNNLVTETERQSMLKLIIGMAIDGYGYDPKASRNGLTGDKNGLSTRLETRGISITADTIRKYLTEAKNIL